MSSAVDLIGKVLSSPQFWTGVVNALAGTWTAILALRARKAAKDSKANAKSIGASKDALDLALNQVDTLSDGFQNMAKKQEETEIALRNSQARVTELEKIVRHVTSSLQSEVKKNSRLTMMNRNMATRLRNLQSKKEERDGC